MFERETKMNTDYVSSTEEYIPHLFSLLSLKADFLTITRNGFVQKMNQTLIHVLTVLHFYKSFINQLLTNDCLLRAYLIRPVAALGLRPVSVLPLSCLCSSFQILLDGLAPPTLLRDWCHQFRAFIIYRWVQDGALSLPLLEDWCLFELSILLGLWLGLVSLGSCYII